MNNATLDLDWAAIDSVLKTETASIGDYVITVWQQPVSFDGKGFTVTINNAATGENADFDFATQNGARNCFSHVCNVAARGGQLTL